MRSQRSQDSPSHRDWLPPDDLAWFVLDAVRELDLTPLDARYRSDGWGTDL
jgi:hypothetical protein